MVKLIKIRIARVLSRVFDSVGLGQGLRICIYDKFSDDVDVSGP